MSFSSHEIRSAVSLAAIFALRMLGLFMIYPVFATYADHLPDAAPVKVGLALGIYGLAQALFQMPLGMLSDRVGRKPVIGVGLLVFAGGSAVAATAHTVAAIAAGRLLQGVGAVGSAVLALAADLTRDENRTGVMGIIGVSIGFAFALALVIGPVLNGWVGVPGMFWLTAALAAVCLLLLYAAVPAPVALELHADSETVPAMFREVLRNRQLWSLDFGILAQHAILTATFLGVPALLEHAGIAVDRQWLIYLPVMLVSAVVMGSLIAFGERGGRQRAVLLGSVAAIGLAQVGLLLSGGLLAMSASMALFFAAFNFLEALLPSWVSRLAAKDAKGTALGIFSSSQFLGLFLGGALGGWCQARLGPAGGFVFSACAATLWFTASWFLTPPNVAEPGRAK